jgi:hypothetical protein
VFFVCLSTYFISKNSKRISVKFDGSALKLSLEFNLGSHWPPKIRIFAKLIPVKITFKIILKFLIVYRSHVHPVLHEMFVNTRCW